jgi:hypothetical protein
METIWKQKESTPSHRVLTLDPRETFNFQWVSTGICQTF